MRPCTCGTGLCRPERPWRSPLSAWPPTWRRRRCTADAAPYVGFLDLVRAALPGVALAAAAVVVAVLGRGGAGPMVLAAGSLVAAAPWLSVGLAQRSTAWVAVGRRWAARRPGGGAQPRCSSRAAGCWGVSGRRLPRWLCCSASPSASSKPWPTTPAAGAGADAWAIRSPSWAPGLPATRSSPTGWCWWTWRRWRRARRLLGRRTTSAAWTARGFRRHLHRARGQLARRRRVAPQVGRRGSRGRERVPAMRRWCCCRRSMRSVSATHRPSRAHVADLLLAVREEVRPRHLQSLVARAIGDPGAVVAWWDPARADFRDHADRLVDVPDHGVLRVEADGRPIAVVLAERIDAVDSGRARLGGPGVAAGRREPPPHRGASGQPGAGT